MITVRIGQEQRSLETADEQWVNQQIVNRRRDTQSDCVMVIIKEGGLDMILSTPGCAGGGGGGRQPTAKEREVFEIWDKRKLNEPAFAGGNLVAFLKQLRNVI